MPVAWQNAQSHGRWLPTVPHPCVPQIGDGAAGIGQRGPRPGFGLACDHSRIIQAAFFQMRFQRFQLQNNARQTLGQRIV